MARLALCLLLVTAGAPGAARSGPSPSLSGDWVRDAEGSDDGRLRIEEAARRVVERTARRSRVASPEDFSDVQRRLEESLQGLVTFAEELRIDESGGELHVDDRSGRIRIFYLDGRKHPRQTPRGTALETVARRVGDRVEIEQKIDGGPKILETYQPSADGLELRLTVRIEGRPFREPLVVRSLYHRNEPL